MRQLELSQSNFNLVMSSPFLSQVQKLKYHEGQQLLQRVSISEAFNSCANDVDWVFEPSDFRCNICTPPIRYLGTNSTTSSAQEPSTAGLSNTFAPANSERTVRNSCTSHWTSIKFLFASSTAYGWHWCFLGFTSTRNQHDRCGLQLLPGCKTKTTSTFNYLVTRLTATKRPSSFSALSLMPFSSVLPIEISIRFTSCINTSVIEYPPRSKTTSNTFNWHAFCNEVYLQQRLVQLLVPFETSLSRVEALASVTLASSRA